MEIVGTRMIREDKTARELFEAVMANPARNKFGFGQKLAIINVDVQQAYTRIDMFRTAYETDPRQIEHINTISRLAREKSMPVIWSRVAYKDDAADAAHALVHRAHVALRGAVHQQAAEQEDGDDHVQAEHEALGGEVVEQVDTGHGHQCQTDDYGVRHSKSFFTETENPRRKNQRNAQNRVNGILPMLEFFHLSILLPATC